MKPAVVLAHALSVRRARGGGQLSRTFELFLVGGGIVGIRGEPGVARHLVVQRVSYRAQTSQGVRFLSVSLETLDLVRELGNNEHRAPVDFFLGA